MKKALKMLQQFFHRTPVPVAPNMDPELVEARSRNVSAAENLHATLAELLDESNRLAFRPVYMVGKEGN